MVTISRPGMTSPLSSARSVVSADADAAKVESTGKAAGEGRTEM